MHAGSLAVDTYTRTRADFAGAKARDGHAHEDVQGRPDDKRTLDFARDYMAGVYPIQSETAEQVAGRVLMVAMYGLPADYNRTFPDKIRGDVVERSASAGQEIFRHGKSWTSFSRGTSAHFRDELKKQYPNATFTEIPAYQLDPLSDDLRAAKQPTKVEATPESLAAGKQILMAAANAAGGRCAEAGGHDCDLGRAGRCTRRAANVAIRVKWQIVLPGQVLRRSGRRRAKASSKFATELLRG